MPMTMLVRGKIKPEFVARTEALAAKLFDQLEEAAPTNIRYASARLGDGETFVAILQLDDPADNPLASLPAFAEFQKGLEEWRAEPSISEPMTVVRSYRLF